MRHGTSVRKLLVASAIAATAVIAAGAAPPGTLGRFSTKSAAQRVPVVTILFMCSGERSVKPWEAHIKSGDDLEWVLDPRSDVDDFRIKRKRVGDRWPFEGTGSINGKKNSPARGKGKAGTAKGTYAYEIEAHCRVQGGMQWKKIDPDIIVDI